MKKNNICAYPTSIKVGDIVTMSDTFPDYWKRNIKYPYRTVISISQRDDNSGEEIITINKPINKIVEYHHTYFKIAIKELRKLKLKKLNENNCRL